MQSKADIVIIGGGLIGCSVAYHLTRSEDMNVALLEKGNLGKGETKVSAAMVMHQTGDEMLSQLARLSVREYVTQDEYVGHISGRAGFRRTGSILYATDPSGAEKIKYIVRMQRRLGIETELLGPSDVPRYAPEVRADDILAASFCPLDGYLDQFKLVDLYADYASHHGVEISENVEATGIRIEHNRIKSVETSAGEIETSIVVNAAGAFAGRIARWVGAEVPIRMNKRDIMIKAARDVTGLPILEDVTAEWYVRPYNGNMLLGVGPTTPIVNLPKSFEVDASPDVAETVRTFLRNRVPILSDAQILTQWGGIRSLTPDGLPILGPIHEVQGFFNCCGFSGFGVTNAAAAGQIIEELIRKGKVTSIELEPFTNKRFPLRWKKKGTDLLIGDTSVSLVAKRFGTPMYLYDGDIILDRIRRIKEALPDLDIWYSVKANPNPSILCIIASRGLGASVTSLNELQLALSTGFPPGRISLGGPGKGLREFEGAIKAGIGTIDIESPRELRILEEIGGRLHTPVRASIRVNMLHRPSKAGEFMAGVPSKFGFDEENIADSLEHLPENVILEGLHAHVASQVLDSSFFAYHCEKVAQLWRKISSKIGVELEFISLGGGFGVPYSIDEQSFDVRALGRRIADILQTEFSDRRNRPVFQVELGRYLVAESGIFLTEIMDLKRSRGINFVITDSGISGFSRPAMPWAQMHRCSIVTKQDMSPTGLYKVVGRSCLPSDVLCELSSLPDPNAGDILAVHDVGAYGYTMSMLMWSSLTPPVEVLFHDNELNIATKRWKPPWREAESGRGETTDSFLHSEA